MGTQYFQCQLATCKKKNISIVKFVKLALAQCMHTWTLERVCVCGRVGGCMIGQASWWDNYWLVQRLQVCVVSSPSTKNDLSISNCVKKTLNQCLVCIYSSYIGVK